MKVGVYFHMYEGCFFKRPEKCGLSLKGPYVGNGFLGQLKAPYVSTTIWKMRKKREHVNVSFSLKDLLF